MSLRGKGEGAVVGGGVGCNLVDVDWPAQVLLSECAAVFSVWQHL